MQQRPLGISRLHATWPLALQRLGAWVLDQPLPPTLEGQCCDRLRPAQIGRDLERALARHSLGHCTVVEWRWDQRRGSAKGWLWCRGLLQRFHWQRQSDELELRHQLVCRAKGAPAGSPSSGLITPRRVRGCCQGPDAIDQHP